MSTSPKLPGELAFGYTSLNSGIPSGTFETLPGAGFFEVGNVAENPSALVPSGESPLVRNEFHSATSMAIGSSFAFAVVLLKPVTVEVCKNAAVAVAVQFQLP